MHARDTPVWATRLAGHSLSLPPIDARTRLDRHPHGIADRRVGHALRIDDDATGYENIMTGGLLLGLAPEEVRELTEEIAAVTELGDYLAMPAHTYSAGMGFRLGSAVCTCFEPEILPMDEWLSVGDRHFVERRSSGSSNSSNARGL